MRTTVWARTHEDTWFRQDLPPVVERPLRNSRADAIMEEALELLLEVGARELDAPLALAQFGGEGRFRRQLCLSERPVALPLLMTEVPEVASALKGHASYLTPERAVDVFNEIGWPPAGLMVVAPQLSGPWHGVMALARRPEASPPSHAELEAFGRMGQRWARLSLQFADVEFTLRDRLTGLYLQRWIDVGIRHVIEEGLPFSIAIFDVDNFKRLNDAIGHQQGDGALIEIARRISAPLEAGDVLGRYGGNQFMYVLPDRQEADASAITRDALARVSREPIRLRKPDGEPVEASMSLTAGLLHVERGAGGQRNDYVKAADRLLYDAKQAGKNQVFESTWAIQRERNR